MSSHFIDEPNPTFPETNTLSRYQNLNHVLKLTFISSFFLPLLQPVLDVLPTKLIKSCLDALAPPITRLINLSLSEGIFPDTFKHAVVSPLLKKPSLPKNQLLSHF